MGDSRLRDNLGKKKKYCPEAHEKLQKEVDLKIKRIDELADSLTKIIAGFQKKREHHI